MPHRYEMVIKTHTTPKYSFLSIHTLYSRWSLLVCLWYMVAVHGFAASPFDMNSNTVYTIANADDGCCFEMYYNYCLPQGITALETSILTTDVAFGAVQFPLGNGWQISTVEQDRRLRWIYGGAEIPANNQALFDFCLQGWQPQDSVSIEIRWLRTGQSIQTDTLSLGCNACWQALNAGIVCNENESYTYTFDFSNESGFTINTLEVFEPSGQNFINTSSIPLAQPLNNGEVSESISLQIAAQAGNSTDICFGITPRRTRADTISIACCSATYCIPLPPCDTCCTDFNDYVANVEEGFTIMGNCETRTLMVQANALNACDEVQYLVSGLGGGIVDGNEVFEIGGLVDEEAYEVCMQVRRQDIFGEDCYPDGLLEICEEYYFNCDFCQEDNNIDLDNDCPVRVDPVCGCDDMTYVNACAAFNWGGLNFWSEGCCGGMDLRQIELTQNTTSQGFVQLNWTLLSTLPLRYYLVQRRLPNGPWFSLNQLSPQEISYIDNEPLNPPGEYRVLGITESGKLLFSEENPDCIVSTNHIQVVEGGRIWPNPSRSEVHIELPISKEQTLYIYDALGRKQHQQTTDWNGHMTLDLDHWPAGTYFVVLPLESGRLWRQTFIHQP